MSDQFAVGEVVILQNDPCITEAPEIKRLNGEEVEIVGPLDYWRVTGGYFYSYMVSHPSCEMFFCAPHELRRRRPPTTGEQAIRAMFDVEPSKLSTPEVA